MQKSQAYGKNLQSYLRISRFILLGFLCLVVIFLSLLLSAGVDILIIISIGVVAFPMLIVWYAVLWFKEKKIKSSLLAKQSIDEVYRSINALDFEEVCGMLFKKEGYDKVVVTKGSKDGGIDIFLQKDGKKLGVQCKKFEPGSFVHIDQVKAFVISLRNAGCESGILVTTGNVSTYTKNTVSKDRIIFIEGDEFMNLYRKYQQ